MLCEESVEDLVDQLGGSGFCGTFVLLLGRMADGLTSFSSPGREGPTLSGWERGHGTLLSLLSGLQFTPAVSLPFSEGDPCQLDQVSHAGGQEDGLLITVPSLIITLYLFHHELGMSQERILSESIQVEHRRRNSGL